MTFRNQITFNLNNHQHLLRNNGKTLIIKQPNILEMQILYEAIRRIKK